MSSSCRIESKASDSSCPADSETAALVRLLHPGHDIGSGLELFGVESLVSALRGEKRLDASIGLVTESRPGDT